MRNSRFRKICNSAHHRASAVLTSYIFPSTSVKIKRTFTSLNYQFKREVFIFPKMSMTKKNSMTPTKRKHKRAQIKKEPLFTNSLLAIGLLYGVKVFKIFALPNIISTAAFKRKKFFGNNVWVGWLWSQCTSKITLKYNLSSGINYTQSWFLTPFSVYKRDVSRSNSLKNGFLAKLALPK